MMMEMAHENHVGSGVLQMQALGIRYKVRGCYSVTSLKRISISEWCMV